MMDKNLLVAAIRERLREQFEARQKSSRDIRAAGNDAETKAEGKYDTRSTEENYLADGLARQAQDAAEAAAAYEDFGVRDFAPDDPIDLGAVVHLRFGPASEWFFLGPAGGGAEVISGGIAVTVITPESPLGAAVMGRRKGARIPAPRADVLAVL